jgi:hypothetical protein
MQNKRTLALEIMGIIGGTATIIALTLAPMLYLGSKMDAHMREFRQDMNEFRKETKQFHGRLCIVEEKLK